MSLSTKNIQKPIEAGILSRAQSCLLGQLTGDALGSLVEFQTPENIRRDYPSGVRKLADGGTWNTIAGQPTDDSEMALMLARALDDQGTYNAKKALEAYIYWLDSGPFDCGSTVATGLRGRPNPDSQANGALMGISPLGIFGANYDLPQVAELAKQDAALTHPHLVCRQANALFAMAISYYSPVASTLGHFAREHLIQYQPQGIYVGPLIHLGTFCTLLGGRVAYIGHPGRRLGYHLSRNNIRLKPGNAKISNRQGILRWRVEDIFRLEVAMENPKQMGGFHTIKQLTKQG